MDKVDILTQIQRTASENNGVPLGQRRFEEVMGIPTSAWRGRYWRNWGEAVRAAGLVENKPRDRYDDATLIDRLIRLTRKNRRFPSYADLRLARHEDNSFPTHHVFARLGSSEQRVEVVRKNARENAESRDILEFLPKGQSPAAKDSAVPNLAEGFVYMVKLGKHYKIGETYAVPRRHREIALELPEKPDIVHVIRTDDPSGIEAYWHARFGACRTNGEWFALTRDDVTAFKKRKFI